MVHNAAKATDTARSGKYFLVGISLCSAVLSTVLVGLAFLGICTKLEVLGSLDGLHALCFALGALELQDDFLRCLCLFVEHGFRLTTETCLLLVVTSLTLSHHGRLACLVLSDFVRPVLPAALAVGVPGLRDVDHGCDARVDK